MRQLILKIVEVVGKKLPPWLPTDKFFHLLLCIMATISGAIFNIFLGIGLGIGVGVGKEFGDMMNPYNKWDWKDLFWDFVGVGVVGGVILVLNL